VSLSSLEATGRRLLPFATRAALIYLVLYAIERGIPWHWIGLESIVVGVDQKVGGWIGAAAYPSIVGSLVRCIVALVGGAAWLSMRRGQPRDAILAQWLFVTTRVILIFVLTSTGLAMMLGVFMQPTTPVDWIRPTGEMGTVAFLRAFMGSGGYYYQIASGLAELIAAGLLLFRQTTTVGAFLTAAALSNIAMMYLVFGRTPAARIDGAWYAKELLIVATLLMLIDWRRLLDVFWFKRRTGVYPLAEWPRDYPFKNAKVYGRVAVVLSALIVNRNALLDWRDVQNKSHLRGAYRVTEFTRNGRMEPLDIDHPDRWRVVAISDHGDRVMARSVADSSFEWVTDTGSEGGASGWRRMLAARQASPTGSLVLRWASEYAHSGQVTLAYARESNTALRLEGVVLGDTLSVTLDRIPDADFALRRPGVPWKE
jgi:hypothetical protein